MPPRHLRLAPRRPTLSTHWIPDREKVSWPPPSSVHRFNSLVAWRHTTDEAEAEGSDSSIADRRRRLAKTTSVSCLACYLLPTVGAGESRSHGIGVAQPTWPAPSSPQPGGARGEGSDNAIADRRRRLAKTTSAFCLACCLLPTAGADESRSYGIDVAQSNLVPANFTAAPRSRGAKAPTTMLGLDVDGWRRPRRCLAWPATCSPRSEQTRAEAMAPTSDTRTWPRPSSLQRFISSVARHKH